MSHSRTVLLGNQELDINFDYTAAEKGTLNHAPVESGVDYEGAELFGIDISKEIEEMFIRGENTDEKIDGLPDLDYIFNGESIFGLMNEIFDAGNSGKYETINEYMEKLVWDQPQDFEK